MSFVVNELGQPVGKPLPNWQPPALPQRKSMEGRYCRLDPLNPEHHAPALFDAFAADDRQLWTYLPYGPFVSLIEFRAWMEDYCLRDDPLFFAVCQRSSGAPIGLAAYLRITPRYGSIEVGHLLFSSELRKTAAATEAMYLMMKGAFELGYRRYEWKCDALNANSRAAAERLGFTFEGLFRQASVYKGRTRDTAWFSIIDGEWPSLRSAFERWLDPANFDQHGRQRARFSDLTRARGVGIAESVRSDFST